MTPAQMGVHVKSTHAAERQYVIASEKMAERSLKALDNGKPLIAKALARWANDLRRWGRAECE
jgi:hypothetical protein